MEMVQDSLCPKATKRPAEGIFMDFRTLNVDTSGLRAGLDRIERPHFDLSSLDFSNIQTPDLSRVELPDLRKVERPDLSGAGSSISAAIEAAGKRIGDVGRGIGGVSRGIGQDLGIVKRPRRHAPLLGILGAAMLLTGIAGALAGAYFWHPGEGPRRRRAIRRRLGLDQGWNAPVPRERAVVSVPVGGNGSAAPSAPTGSTSGEASTTEETSSWETAGAPVAGRVAEGIETVAQGSGNGHDDAEARETARAEAVGE